MQQANPELFVPDGFPLTVADLKAILMDRKWYLLVPFVLVILASAIGAILYPASYVSTAKIVVEGQQIPEDLVRSTITSSAAERIDYITQRVLTRDQILTIAKNLDLYREDDLSDTKLVKRFRENVEVKLVNAGLGVWNSQTIAFAVSFNSPEPAVAMEVANELVTMYLNENVKTRSARAAQTTEFLAEESERIRQQTVLLERQIAQFKDENRTVLPGLVQMNLSLMSRYENDYQSTLLAMEELAAERRVLEVQREQYAKTGDSAAEPTLLQLERAYQEVLIRNTPEHPEARELKRKIDDLKAARRALPVEPDDLSGGESEPINDPVYTRLVAQLQAITRKEQLLRATRADLRRKLDEQEARIARSPIVEQEYLDLQRDMKNLEAKYQELKNKELEATISQNLEEDQKGERFSLLEPAVLPQQPETPGKLIIVAAGCIAALGLGFGLVVIREFLAPGIRSENTFGSLLGADPVIDIPEFSGVAVNRSLTWMAVFMCILLVTTLAFGVALQLEWIEIDQLTGLLGQ